MLRFSRSVFTLRRYNHSGASVSAGAHSVAPTLAFALASAATAATAAAPKNPYKVLGLKQGAPKEDIKKAYRVMARKHHPDAPGGSHDKFQEIQAAYEEIKSGVWVQKGGGGDGSSSGEGQDGRYTKFRYDMRGKRKVSYDQAYSSLHGHGGPKHDDFDDEAAGAKRAAGERETAVQAWFRFILLWAGLFVTLRLVLFMVFPPKHHHHPKKPMPDKPRKPPPPKPLMSSPMIA